MQTGTEGILLGMAPLALLGVQNSPALMILIGLPLLAVQRAGRQAIDNERLALQDALTGLANRTCLADRGAQALARARRDGTSAAVLLIDLDRFKDINDTLGHHAGDRVLRAVAERIDGTVRDQDTVARLGGDEFAVLLPDVASPEEAVRTARRVLDAIDRAARDRRRRARAQRQRRRRLLPAARRRRRRAAAPRRRRDVHGQGGPRRASRCYTIGDEQRQAHAAQARRPPRATRSPRARSSSLYQPQVRPHTGEIVGVEALARWRHPQFGAARPGHVRAARRALRATSSR